MTAAALPAGHALVVNSGTPLRDRAGSPAAVLQTLSRGDTVELLERDGSFLHVRLEGGTSGYVDAVNVTGREAVAPPPPAVEEPPAQRELPFGLTYLPEEALLHEADFLYDPFGDRALSVTTLRVVIGGGGTSLPRVVEIAEVTSVGMREGSNGMALGERTLVLTAASVSGEIYISGLRDARRAATAIEAAQTAWRARLGMGDANDIELAAIVDGVTMELERLWMLHQSGAIGSDEYARQKARLLALS